METENKTQFTIKDNFIFVSGILDGPGADALMEALPEGNLLTLDFSEVTDIKFAALRSMLRNRKAGKRFQINNASPEVAERFEDTGVSAFINICRKPKPLHIEQYEEFGASFLSKAFNSADGDSMIKVYGSRVPKWLAAQEKTIARNVMIFGIPTPLVGALYENGDNTGIDFERIEGKRSYSRIMAEEPDRIEEMSRRFARMCKELHSTECDTSVFADRTIYYRNAILRCKELSDDQKQKVIAFIDSIPAATTCLHGDMQPSNVITNGVDDLWIDLSDFGYGNPMLDMGMWYFQSKLNTEEICQHLFHMSKEQMAGVWDFFVEEYFGAVTPEAKAEIDLEAQKFAALHMLYLGSTYGFQGNLLEYATEKLL